MTDFPSHLRTRNLPFLVVERCTFFHRLQRVGIIPPPRFTPVFYLHWVLMFQRQRLAISLSTSSLSFSEHSSTSTNALAGVHRVEASSIFHISPVLLSACFMQPPYFVHYLHVFLFFQHIVSTLFFPLVSLFCPPVHVTILFRDFFDQDFCTSPPYSSASHILTYCPRLRQLESAFATSIVSAHIVSLPRAAFFKGKSPARLPVFRVPPQTLAMIRR